MDTFLGHTPNGMGLANTAVLSSLIEFLVAKGAIPRSDGRKILIDARNWLAPYEAITPVLDAMDIITKQIERLPE